MKKKTYKFSMPLYLLLSDKPRKCKKPTRNRKLGDPVPPKKYHLNLNAYSIWFHHIRAALKVKYTEMAVKILKGIKMQTPIKLTFVHYYPDLRSRDRANVCCIHEKFFCDAMQEAGCIPNDNDFNILETRYITGGLDRQNARMEIIIEEV